MKWPWILLSFAALFCLGIVDNARGPLYPDILKYFSIDTSIGSLMFSSASLSGLLISIFNSYWLNRFGALNSLKVFVLMQALAALGMASSGLSTSTFYIMIIFSSLFGIGTSGAGICVNILVAQGVPEKFRRRALSGLHSMYGIASLLVPLFIGVWFQNEGQWFTALGCLAVFPLGVFIYSLLIKKEILAVQKEKTSSYSKSSLFFFGSLLALAVSSELSLSTQIPLYCTRALKFSSDKASFYLSLFFVFLTLGRLLFLFLPFKGKSFYWLMLSMGGASFCAFLGLQGHPLFLSLCGLFISVFFPCSVDWISEIYRGKIDRLLANIMSIVGIFIVCMHFLIGKLGQEYGIDKALLLAPLFQAFALVLIIWGCRKKWNN